MNGSKFAEMRKLAGKFENSVDESDDVDTDWQDLMLRDGYVNSHDVSVSVVPTVEAIALARLTIRIKVSFLLRTIPVTLCVVLSIRVWENISASDW